MLTNANKFFHIKKAQFMNWFVIALASNSGHRDIQVIFEEAEVIVFNVTMLSLLYFDLFTLHH